MAMEKMPKARDLGEANRMIQVLWREVHEQYAGKRISQILAAVLAIAAILPWFLGEKVGIHQQAISKWETAE